ncbi:MAG: ArnT family glycosyltransferase [Acidobacteriota bacterium]
MTGSTVDLRFSTALILALGVLARVLYLDADPNYYESLAYVTDEGRWVYHARNLTLYNSSQSDDLYNVHLILSPLFQLANYVIFELAGFSRLTTRVWTAASGSALLLLFWFGLRRTVTPHALLVGVVLLALQIDLVALSRVAMPEMAALFFVGASYFAMVVPRNSPRAMWLSGLLMLIAVGMKGTVAPALGILSLVILFMPRDSRGSTGISWRWRALLWFWIGVSAPVLVGASLGALCCVPESALAAWQVNGTRYAWGLLTFIQPSTLYRALAFPFTNVLAPSVNFLAIGLWLSWLGWMASHGDLIDARSKRYLATSAIWIGGFSVVMLSLAYFPHRYKTHILLPMIVNITVGLSLLQRAGVQNALVRLQRAARGRAVKLAVLTLPTAIFMAPLLARATSMLGTDPESLRVQLGCVIASTGLTTYAAHRLRDDPRALACFILFPIIMVSIWLLLSLRVALNASFWPGPNSTSSVWWLVGAVGVAATVTSVILRRGAEAATARLLCNVYVTAHLTAALIRMAPGYLDPHYTIRDISQEVGRSASSARTVGSLRSEGLFNDNEVRYLPFMLGTEPEIVVTAFEPPAAHMEVLRTRYHVIQTYSPYVSPEFQAAHPADTPLKVRVYRRKAE